MKRVLVIEDNQDIRTILQKRLETTEFEATMLEDGYSLLTYLRQGEEPDVVILDLMLPGRSGTDLLYSIKCKWPDTKVFIFSAHAEYSADESLQGYIQGFISKSEGIEKLISAMHKAVV